MVSKPQRGSSADYETLYRFARSVAAAFARRSRSDLQDLIGAGYLGLADAIRLHPNESPERFATLAKCRIRGAIRDELRRSDTLSRYSRKAYRDLLRVEQRLALELGRAPDDEEVARGAALSADDVRHLRALGTTRERSIEADYESAKAHEPMTRPSAGPDAQALRRDEAARVARALAGRPQREAMILRALYAEGRTLSDIAAELGVTEARISQLHAAALRHLREEVARAENGRARSDRVRIQRPGEIDAPKARTSEVAPKHPVARRSKTGDSQ